LNKPYFEIIFLIWHLNILEGIFLRVNLLDQAAEKIFNEVVAPR